LDLALVLILVLCVFLGVRKGFAKMLVRVVGTVLAVLVAALLSGQVAGGIYDAFLNNGIQTAIRQQIPTVSAENIEEGIDEAIATLPEFILDFAEQQNLDLEALAGQVLEQVDDQAEDVSALAAETLSTQVVRPIAVSLLTLVCFFVLLIVLLIAVRLLAGIVDKVFNLPLLGTINKVLGGVLGAVQGVLWVLVAVTAIELIAGTGTVDSLLNAQVLDQTVLTKWLAGLNPITAEIRNLTGQIDSLTTVPGQWLGTAQ
jgi:uncharacterized membrane protein required for colicin V production